MKSIAARASSSIYDAPRKPPESQLGVRSASMPIWRMPSLDIVIPAFNAEHCLQRTLEAIFEPTVPAGLILGIIVVNNRSTDNTAQLIAQWADNGVQRVDFDEAQGRAATINAGVAASTANYVLILDADCRPIGKRWLELIVEVMATDTDAGFGYATGSGESFWDKYHRSLVDRRIAAGWRGWTTACCLIKRERFESVGGFSSEYRHYGFEDRDLVCKLRSVSGGHELRSLPDLQVSHDDAPTVADVSEKMYLSGRYSSGIFRRNFSAEYLATSYASVDVDTASGYVVLALRTLQPLRGLLVWLASNLAAARNAPLAVGRPAIRLCSALSYFRGTVDRNAEQ